MENLGEFLRQQRESKNVSIEELATRTRIAVRFIKLIEESQFDQLPNVVSAKGFLRSYARCLNLDEMPILNRFSEAIQPAADRTPPISGTEENVPTYIQRKQPDRLPFPLWAAFSVVGVILLFLVLAFIIPKHRQATPPPPPTEEAPAPEPAPVEPSSPIPPPESSANPVSPAPPSPPPPAPSPTPSAAPGPAASPQEAAAPRVLMIEAIEPSWVHVTIDGAKTKEALLQPNEKVRWEAKEKFVLTVGNAGGVRVLLDGQDLGSLGPTGRVVKKEIVAKR